MTLQFNESLGIIKRSRTFNSVNKLGPQDKNNWVFKYITKTKNHDDAGELDDNTPLQEPSDYPEETIFFNSPSDSFDISSSVNDIIIDNTPIELLNVSIQYTSLAKGHKCILKYKSNTAIDIRNISISCGPVYNNNIIYYASRKQEIIVDTETTSNISIIKNDNIYTLTFILNDDFNIDLLNEFQLYIQIWNIAGSTLLYHTPDDSIWKRLTNIDDINTFNNLIISFNNWTPNEDKQLLANETGTVRVTIYNPNEDLWSIKPTFELTDDSIGYINPTTISYNELEGILTFTVSNIQILDDYRNKVIINAWLKIGTEEIDTTLKEVTKAHGEDLWPFSIYGRRIKLMQNVPGYFKDSRYNKFVKTTENFLNTMYTSLSDNKHIGILEKMLRIGHFNNIKKLETALLDNYKNEYNITIDPNLDTLKTFLETKKYETTPNTRMSPEAAYIMANADTEINDDILKKTTKKFIFDSLTGDELYSFIKDIYKNIPYYNQMSGTYRGISFILDQLGLCVKLVEIWSDKSIRDNFDHDEHFYREDELNAVRKLIPDDTLATIGNLYLTSRFDVDVLDSDLTFEEFNAMAYNIVKVILAVKPIHRVLRNLTYLFNIKCNMHFQYFLLDKLNSNYGCNLGNGVIAQKLHKFTYIWNLYDNISKYKSQSIIVNDNVYMSKIYAPYTTIFAETTFDPSLFNIYGEYKIDPITGKPKIFFDEEKTQKPINESAIPLEKPIPTSKNSYHTLANFATKIKRSRLTELRISFIHLSEDSNKYVHINGGNALFKNGEEENNYKITINYNTLIITAENITTGVSSTINLCDWLVGKQSLDILPNVKKTWQTGIFKINEDISIEQDRNGFYINLYNTAQQLFSNTLHINPKANDTKLLFMRIDNLMIPLGTDYICQGEPYDIDVQLHTLISEKSSSNKIYHLMSDENQDYLVDELSI